MDNRKEQDWSATMLKNKKEKGPTGKKVVGVSSLLPPPQLERGPPPEVKRESEDKMVIARSTYSFVGGNHEWMFTFSRGPTPPPQ